MSAPQSRVSSSTDVSSVPKWRSSRPASVVSAPTNGIAIRATAYGGAEVAHVEVYMADVSADEAFILTDGTETERQSAWASGAVGQRFESSVARQRLLTIRDARSRSIPRSIS
jgi:hypothetical protein